MYKKYRCHTLIPFLQNQIISYRLPAIQNVRAHKLMVRPFIFLCTHKPIDYENSETFLSTFTLISESMVSFVSFEYMFRCFVDPFGDNISFSNSLDLNFHIFIGSLDSSLLLIFSVTDPFEGWDGMSFKSSLLSFS